MCPGLFCDDASFACFSGACLSQDVTEVMNCSCSSYTMGQKPDGTSSITIISWEYPHITFLMKFPCCYKMTATGPNTKSHQISVSYHFACRASGNRFHLRNFRGCRLLSKDDLFCNSNNFTACGFNFYMGLSF